MSKEQIVVSVSGVPESGSLHVMATIERALKKVYSGVVVSPELDDERDERGNISARRPAESMSFLIKEIVTEAAGE